MRPMLLKLRYINLYLNIVIVMQRNICISRDHYPSLWVKFDFTVFSEIASFFKTRLKGLDRGLVYVDACFERENRTVFEIRC